MERSGRVASPDYAVAAQHNLGAAAGD